MLDEENAYDEQYLLVGQAVRMRTHALGRIINGKGSPE